MKRALAFGDSLTWGSCPHSGGRHAPADRWPVVMAAGLDGVEVIAEGLRGRTTVYDRPSAAVDMNGGRILPVLLHSHAPLDLVMIMLGTNDIYEGKSAYHVRDGLERLVELVRFHPWRLPQSCNPALLLISPPPMTPGPDPDVTPEKVALSEVLTDVVAGVAQQTGAGFFDAASIGRASLADGYHLEADASRRLGTGLRAPVAELLQLS